MMLIILVCNNGCHNFYPKICNTVLMNILANVIMLG